MDAMHSDIRRLATNLDIKIHGLQQMFSGASEGQVAGVQHLREFVQSAATVLSSASTVLSADQNDISSERDVDDFRSDFSDWFRTDETNASTLDWIYSSSGDTPLFGISDTKAGKQSLPIGSSSTDRGLMASTTISSSAVGPAGNASPNPKDDMEWSTSVSSSILPTLGLQIQNREKDIEVIEATVNGSTLSSEPLVLFEHQRGVSTNSALSLVPAPATKEKKRSLSSLFSRKRFVGGEKPMKVQQESKPQKTLALDNLSGPETRRKFMFVGDGACGKTCFLMFASIFYIFFSG